MKKLINKLNISKKYAAYPVGVFLFLMSLLAFPNDASAALRSWDGGGADTDWNTCANWSADTCPTSIDTVLFDATSTKNATLASTSMTVAGMTINSGYSGTISFGSSVVSISGALVQNAGTLTLSSATTTLRGDVAFNGGTTNHNSGLVQFANSNSTAITATTTGVTFNNVLFDYIHGSGGTTIVQLGSDMTVAGNLQFKNGNTNNANLTVRSSAVSTARTITVAGSVTDIVTSQTGSLFIGNSADTNRIVISLSGDLNLQDGNTTLYADLAFASSSTQTVTKSTTVGINAISDWFDTGSGNLALGSNFTGSMTFNVDDSSDFTFSSSAFTLSAANASITAAATYTPSGASSTTFTNLFLLSGSGTFTANSSTTLASTTIAGGTFNLASNATTTFTGPFLFTGGTFNHNNGTATFNVQAASQPITITAGSAVFNNLFFDYVTGDTSTGSIFLGSNLNADGNLIMRNTQPLNATLNVQSNLTATNRIIAIGGDLSIPSTTQTGTLNIGPSSGTANVTIDLKGNFSMADSNATLYGDLVFSSSSTQTISRTAGTINAASDWSDTGAGNLALTANFTGSMNLVTDSTDDFNFAATAFTFTANSFAIATGTSFSPAGPSSYIFASSTMTTGTFNASVASTSFGNFTLAGGTFNGGTGTTTFTGALTYLGGTYNGNGGVAAFVLTTGGAIVTISPGAMTFSRVLFDYPINSASNGVIALASDMIIGGNLYIQNTNSSASPGSLAIRSSSAVNRNVSVAGSLIMASTSQTGATSIETLSLANPLTFDIKGDFNMADSGVVLYADLVFSSTSDQTLTRSNGTINAASDWSDTGSGNFILTSNFSGSMNLVTDSASDFNFAPTPFTFSAGNASVTAATTFNPEGPSTYTINTLTLSTGTLTASAASTTIGTLAVSGGTFNAGSGTTTVISGFTYSSGTFNHNNGLFFFSQTTAGGNSTLTPGSAVFYDVLFDYPVSSGSTGAYNLAGDMTIGRNLRVQNTNPNIGPGPLVVQSSVSGTPRTITVGGDFTYPTTAQTGAITFGGNATNRIFLNVAGDFRMLDVGASGHNATTTLNGTSTQTINKSSGNITSSGAIVIAKSSGQAILSNTFNISGSLDVATGTLKTSGFVVNPTAGFSVSSAGTLIVQTAETLTATPTLAVSSTVIYEGTSTSASTVKPYTYGNLWLQAGSNTLTLTGTTTVAGDLDIQSGTLDASSTRSYGLSVGGNWYNTGTFTPRNGTVTLDGSNQTVYGTTTFYNLTKSVASAATLTFATTTQTVSGVWTANGASSNLLSLRSTNPGTQWRIDPQAARTLSYIDVQDSYNINASAINIDGTMVNSGNNTNWTFDSIPPIATVTSTSTGTSTAVINWTTDEPATSTLQYGPTTGYGSQATSSGTTTHTVSLSGLTEGTLYHFKITSVDAASNATSTADMTFATTDATPPTVSITSPSAGTYNGTISLAATTTDNIGVVGVKFYLDTTLIGSEDTSAPFTGSLVSTGFSDGSYTLRAVARDAAGNQATSTGVALTIDNTAPVATGIASTTSTTSATISWSTAEAATSTVQYGTTPSFGSQATSSATSTHSATLSGLIENTLYYFRITSIDALGNLGTSTTAQFRTTDGTAPAITGIASSTTYATATVSWNTNEAATSTIQYGPTTGYGSQATSSGTTTHSAVLSGLTAGTLYHYRITAIDASGNISTSTDRTFTTSAAPDTTAPTITSIVAAPGTSTASVAWNTSEAATSTVQYGLTASYGSQATSSGTSTHSVSLSGLSDGVVYHYKVTAIDASGNASSTADLTFTTADGTAPVITLQATSTSNTTATISWTTNEAASSTISYGLTTGYGSASSSPGTTTHTVVLSGLTPLTTYHFKINATDASSNAISTADFTFATLATPDTDAPTALSIVTVVSSTTATTTWNTNEPAYSRMVYGLTASYGQGTAYTVATSSAHSVSLTGLSAATTYHFALVNRDAAGNISTTTDATFTTDEADAPSISGGSPTGVLAFGTTQTTISVNTDENATCRYETSAGIAYGSMANTFSTTGGMNHSTLVTGLSNGNSYAYYVRCIDSLNNANGSDYQITFSVATSAPVVPAVEAAPQPGIQPGAQVGQETPGGPAFTTLMTPEQAPGFLRAQQRAGQLAKIDEIARTAAEAQARARAAAFKFIFLRNLRLGDKGIDVLNLQKALNLLGFKVAAAGPGSPGNETTLFGPATKQAVIRFQNAYNVKPASGFFGPLTRAKMNALLAK